jgi:hypothetical protein
VRIQRIDQAQTTFSSLLYAHCVARFDAVCSQLREAAAQSSDVQREVGLLRMALEDKERQLAVLLAETERLQGRPVSSSSSYHSWVGI